MTLSLDLFGRQMHLTIGLKDEVPVLDGPLWKSVKAVRRA